MVPLETIYIVPAIASNSIDTLKIKLYGVRKIDMIENIHIEAKDMNFAFNLIAPVSRNSDT